MIPEGPPIELLSQQQAKRWSSHAAASSNGPSDLWVVLVTFVLVVDDVHPPCRRRLQRRPPRSKLVSPSRCTIHPTNNAFTIRLALFASALRIRPTTPQDATSIPSRFQRTVIHAVSSNTVSVDSTPSTQASGSQVPSSPAPAAASSASPAKKQSFTFDQVHGQDATQHEVFVTTAEPLIHRFLEGFNCTVLAYGQTSSGKTFVRFSFYFPAIC